MLKISEKILLHILKIKKKKTTVNLYALKIFEKKV